MQPPWSMATSTTTAPFFMLATMSRVTILEAAVEDVVKLAQAVQVQVNECDLGPHAQRDLGRVDADDASADDADICGRYAGDAPQQQPAAAKAALQIGGAHLH